jgi:predicted acyltransferase
MSVTSPVLRADGNQRLVSLDIFRGFTILFMIIVNSSGDQSFTPLQHAEWNGWTLTDLVFPFFLFITGVSLTFSFASRLKDNGSRLRLLPHILRRTLVIIAIGLLLNAFPHHHPEALRYAGVLQRIALCYFAGSVLYLWTGVRTRWAIIAALLIGYWLVMRFVPVPGFGIPGVDIPLLDPNRNLAAWLDRKVMWGRLYDRVRDPEGILSTFPAIANTLFGIVVGEWIRSFRADPANLLRRLVAVGVACFAAGELWSLIFPINKQLWTSSYVLITTGMAMIVFAGCYWLMDEKNVRGSWTIIPMVFGTNCIFAYAFSQFVAMIAVTVKIRLDGNLVSYRDALSSYTFDNISQPQWSSLAYSLFYAGFCWFFTWLLYRRKIFLKI